MRLLSPASVLVLLALSSCATDDTPKEDTSGDTPPVDTYVQADDPDGDGITEGDGDCAPDDAEIYPGREEDCNGIDDNCNAVVDEGLPDGDDDGTADCQDAETCDGVDNDGDGEIDEDFSDEDGNGVPDCLGTEVCDGADNDADGEVDEGFDADGDGYFSCGEATDCDDTDASISPAENEDDSDRVDNDCDGLIDESGWAAGSLAISEVLNNPAAVADPDGEWFEVYNTTNGPLILNGLLIMDSYGESHVVTSDEVLEVQAGDFFVFGGNDDMSANGAAVIDYKYSGIVLSNESDDLMIYADGVLIDAVTWDDGATMPDATGASMGLDLNAYDAIANDNPEAWCVAKTDWVGNPSTDKGSPRADNEYCSSIDHDGDGYNSDDGDCDDGASTTYPGAPETDDPADNDCDGDEETQPTAVATASGTFFTCDDIMLDGTDSTDIEDMPLTYLWELTGAPADSLLTSASIITTTSATPTFAPDVVGEYVFTLVVNDGGTDSAPASVTVTVVDRGVNATPVAYAGPDQSGSGSVTCESVSYGTSYSCDDCSSSTYTLDGSGSSDADGDDLSYAWAVREGSSYGTLSSDSGSSVTLTISGVTATYGSDTTEQVNVELTVEDCMGASSNDSVLVSYTCTGS